MNYKNNQILSVILGISAFFGLFSGLLFFAPSVEAASACSTNRYGVFVSFEGRFVTFTNSSGECKQIGLAVYSTTASGARESDYYSARVMDLQPGKSYTIPALIPPCYHVIMTFTGEALRNAPNASSYGDRFIQERAFIDNAYCPTGYRPSGTSQTQYGSNTASPSPTYYAPGTAANYPPYNSGTNTGTSGSGSGVPLPKDAASQTPYTPGEISYTYPDTATSSVPLPDGSVLGAATSTDPFAAKTGAEGILLGTLAATALFSGGVLTASRRERRLSLVRL